MLGSLIQWLQWLILHPFWFLCVDLHLQKTQEAPGVLKLHKIILPFTCEFFAKFHGGGSCSTRIMGTEPHELLVSVGIDG